MEFNAANVMAVVQTFIDLQSSLEKAEEMERAARDYLVFSVNQIGPNTFSNWIRNDVQEDSNYEGSVETNNIVTASWKYIHSKSAARPAHILNQKYNQRIQSDFAAVRNKTNGLRWLFTSKNKKTKAEDAFQDLEYLLNNEYGPMARNIAAQVQNGQKDISVNEAVEELSQNSNQYKQEISHALVEKSYKEPLVSNSSELISRMVKIQDQLRIAKSKSSEDSWKDKISKQAEQSRQRLAFHTLSKIPVDELKRETSNGIRLKPLKESGYSTVADICSTNVYQLSSINGISESSARELKRAADKYAKTISKSTKFKLSADDKNPEATALLSLIYKYKSFKKQLDSLNQSSHSDYEINQAIGQLKLVGNGVLWPFYSKQEKEKVRQAYNYLQPIAFSDYGRDVNRLAHMGEVQVSADEVWDDFQNEPVTYINILENICPDLLGDGDSLYGLPEDLAREIQDEAFFPDGLTCELRPYQTMGVKYILHQKRVLLGDEMGLGKTIQAIATMVSLKNTGATHFIVVCPASVLTNWFKEIHEKSKLRACIIHGSGKKKALKAWIKSGGVAVTTYEATKTFDLEDKFQYDLLIVDEAHYIKSAKAQRSQSVRELASKTDRLLFLSGTPLENKVDEMISLIEILQPKIANRIKGMAFMSTAPQFREAVAPVYYRRKRDSVLTELPEKEEIEEWCDLKPLEKDIYERSVMKKNFADMRRVSWNVDSLKNSSKADHLKDLVKQAADEKRKILVFSFFRSTIDKIANAYGSKCMGPINGSVPVKKRQEIIDKFEQAPAGTILLAQIQAGGTGLNIQSASVVILCEPQLKPSIENQAISRAYRMGQTRNVLVYRLLCSNSVDERMLERLKEKQRTFDAFADKSVAAETQEKEIDQSTINEIIQEEIDRINQEKEKIKSN